MSGRLLIDKANQALGDLNAGKDFSEVAKTYGTDAKSQAGGDLGVIPQIAVSDDTLGQALFKLPLNGTSGVVRGADGTYHVGRVTEIDPGQEDSNLKIKLLAKYFRGERPPAPGLPDCRGGPADQDRQRRPGPDAGAGQARHDLHRRPIQRRYEHDGWRDRLRRDRLSRPTTT